MMNEFFAILLDAAETAGEGDVRSCYHQLNIVMHRAVEQRLNGSKIHFGGLFAKIDYLCKECEVDNTVAYNLNALRHRLKGIDAQTVEILQEWWANDLEALTLFIGKIYAVAVPDALRAVFPKQHKKAEQRQIITDYLRMVVRKCDGRYIYGTTDEAGEVKVKIPQDYEYIKQLLTDGTLLNIIKPRKIEEDSAVLPELIIYQPDYLVDITSVAGCFESYADTPYVSLLSHLKMVYPTKAIHLGNLASQFLDEEVHRGRHGEDDELTKKKQYSESIINFFHHNALAMAAATDIDASFHEDAMRQKDNIRIAVQETLKTEVGRFDNKKVLLEPSFFCEMLGLQGRMDLLQTDYRVLIEQKSGKGGFPQSDPDVPVYVDKHYVQMLLYMAMLHYGYKRDGQTVRNSDIQTFLLYSKYKRGLVRLGPAPELLHEAIMLRNQITWLEMSLSNGGADILLRLTPDRLRRKQMSEKFWMQWIRPQIAAVLSPIQQATPLEQAYFLRMMQFVATEHIMSKMGTNTKESSGFASRWHDTLADKLLAGDILHALKITEMGREEKAVIELTLQAETTDSAMSANFRKGDIVALYAYEQLCEPDIRQTIVHRGSISDIIIDEKNVTVIIRLKSPQTDDTIFKQRRGWVWALEHDFYESSSTAAYRSLHQFLTAPTHRKALILGQRQPDVDESKTLCGNFGAFDELVLRAKQAKDLFLVIGPPGTGKTSFGLMNILREHFLDDTENRGAVLLMAYTNRAVDEICSKLVHPDDGGEAYEFVRVGNALSCEEIYKEYLLEHKCAECRNINEIRELIQRTRIFVGTTTSMTSAAPSLFRLKSFDLAIVDEASQILEPQLLGLLSATDGVDVAIKKFVLIGDHKQLPAVVQQSEADSKVTNPLLQEIGLTDCRNSLFERLLNRYRDHSYFLSRQGRMHPDIAQFPNIAFYDGQLGIAGLPHQLEPTADTPRVEFIAVEKPERSVSDKVNENEARVIAQIVFQAWQEAGDDFDALKTVGVIVPYRNQITAVRKAIESYGIPALHDITIDTVERYQGSQRELIVYGFTVQYVYQLAFLASNTFEDPITGALIDRRLNVALTRARRREVIVGNPDILNHNPIFKRLIESV